MEKLDKFEPDEISIRQLMLKFKFLIKYIFNKKRIILYFIAGGLFLGGIYDIFQKINYKAVSTFVLDDNGHKGSLGLSEFSGLASIAGLDIGSGAEKGLFEGDNILELYRSRRMIQKTLLSPITINNKKLLLIDLFIKVHFSPTFWSINNPITNMSFNSDARNFSRRQDSVLREITKFINKNVLFVSKPDKKLSIIEVEVKFNNEVFAEFFNKKLVQNVNEFYINTQTGKALQNVRTLQHQADSVRNILNGFIGKVAESKDNIPNPNPIITSLQVPFQKKQIDVQANSAIYSEVVKNLELAKISLRHETPLIQIIDEPILPLDDDKTALIKSVVLGAVFGFFMAILFIAGKRFYFFIKNE